jgi:1-acyl-sn-glycerol-3-phosphate acyltransferase
MIGIRCAVIGEPVLAVEEEHLRRASGSVGRCYLLGLVVEKRKGEALFLGALLHVVDAVAEIAGVRVHGDETRAARIVARDVVQPILPGDHVRAVDAGENDGDRLPTEVLERMGLSVDCWELEGRGGVSERESCHARHAIQVGPLYDAVGVGMWAYSNAAFRVVVIGPRRFRLDPRTLIVSTHRRETDVPVIAPLLYFGGRLWRYRDERMSFAARDDMFLPGFFAGFPPNLSPKARRLLFPIGVRRFLPRVQVHPISSASVARAGELLRSQPDSLLEDVVPVAIAGEFRSRSADHGLSLPQRSGDVLRGEYADLLWLAVTREEMPDLDGFWGARAATAAADFRRLVELVRAGGSLLVFPEGRPSPDGEIGPLRRGLAALVRRARPRWFLPVAPAYDPLRRGRTRVVVTVGPRVEPPAEDVEAATLELLRLATPLTCGQYVAHELLSGRDPDAEGLEHAVDDARSEQRPVDPELLDSTQLRIRLIEAIALAERRPGELPVLAREYASARGSS